ncbi:MAG: hypothetical protein QOE76_1101 [Frankiales bacterium]|jgi:hypothetical protein|nr:hypothetical protein [Frankiales bacterium]
MTETSDLSIVPPEGSDTEGGSAEEQELAGPGAGLSSVDGQGQPPGQTEDDLAGPH